MPQKLLLADDSVTIQRVIELTFADEDVQVVAVGDGRQAIDRIAAERPDIVLADVGMPGCDGYEVSSFVKHTPDLAHIPVLLLTGAFEPVDEARAAASRCDGILAKPFEPQQLIAKVKDLLSSHRRPVAAVAAPAPDSAMPTRIGPGPGVAEQLGAAPPAEPDRNTPAEDLDLVAPLAPRDRSSLDDYFDRLDAAFAHLASNPVSSAVPAQEAPADDVRIDEIPWSGFAAADTAGPEIVVPVAPVGPPAAATVPADVAAPLASNTVPQIFSALLDAEQGQGAPLPAGSLFAQAAVPDPDELAEQVTAKVIGRLADREVRELAAETVREVAERVVREEIERLKARIDAAYRP